MFFGGTIADVERACTLASSAFDVFRESGLEVKGAAVEVVAEELLALGDALIERACAETGLPKARLRGRARAHTRSAPSLRGHRAGGHLMEPRIDRALSTRAPMPRPDLRQRHIAPWGPSRCLVRATSQLAFSVQAGGGHCIGAHRGLPRGRRSHPAHIGTSELTGRAVQKAVAASGFPAVCFRSSRSRARGRRTLVADPRIRAVGFTRSRRGGRRCHASSHRAGRSRSRSMPR